MPAAVKTSHRVRRPPEVARQQILDEAERAFVAGGIEAVRVQTVARAVGITDAAVHYHFGSREGLLNALLRRGGRRLREELTAVVNSWDSNDLDIADLARVMDDVYDARGYARLSMWLNIAGYKPKGAAMFEGLAQAIHRARVQAAKRAGRKTPRMRDTLFVIELLTLVVWAEALSGEAWRRAVGLPADRETRRAFITWFTDIVSDHVTDA